MSNQRTLLWPRTRSTRSQKKNFPLYTECQTEYGEENAENRNGFSGRDN